MHSFRPRKSADHEVLNCLGWGAGLEFQPEETAPDLARRFVSGWSMERGGFRVKALKCAHHAIFTVARCLSRANSLSYRRNVRSPAARAESRELQL